jgi:hypothetical protein
MKVISGGQSGVDLAALDAARELSIPTGGWMPKGWLTEDGVRQEYGERYGMREHASGGYPPRTRQNVQDATATLILFRGTLEGGTRLTANMAQQKGGSGLWLGVDLGKVDDETVEFVCRWLATFGPEFVLNVAGPRESKAPGIYAAAKAFLLDVLKGVRDERA